MANGRALCCWLYFFDYFGWMRLKLMKKLIFFIRAILVSQLVVALINN